MDPWGLSSRPGDYKELPEEQEQRQEELKFESSFIPDTHGCDRESVKFEKLPDSENYLERLEKKLVKVKGGAGGRRREEACLVQELREGKETALAQLVLGEAREEEEQEQEVRPGYLVRRLVPQQPLTQGEQQVLTGADHLERLQEQQEQKEHQEQEVSE